MSGGSVDPSSGSSDGGGSERDAQTAGDPSPRGEPSNRFGAESDSEETARVTIEDDGVVRWFLRSEDENVLFARDMLSSVVIVAVIGLILFGVSGVWPPLVAVESPSMDPNMKTGDLIFVAEDDRFVGDGAVADTGVVTLENGRESGHEKFGNPGDVIVFRPNGNERTTPIIHRAHFWVEEDENWVETKADEDIIGDITCADIDDEICPADHAGFITKGDANSNYDQVSRTSGADTGVVKSEWIAGKAMFRIPWVGNIRLTFDKFLGGTLTPSTAPTLDGVSSPESPSTAANPPGIAGMTGLAACGGGAVTAIGRRRN
ncbi:S26 family signal peptidase [Haloterrigena salinisoli]|uniref:S26 family signal peptidase n=1 Tax=Haloterrigena salinisoli TaxID=3132747 RepID=UPI00387E51AD